MRMKTARLLLFGISVFAASVLHAQGTISNWVGINAFRGALIVNVRSAGTTTVTTSDYFICVTSLPATVTLPAGVLGMTFLIKDCAGTAGTSNITVATTAGNIDGLSTYSIATNYGSVAVTYNGSVWSLN